MSRLRPSSSLLRARLANVTDRLARLEDGWTSGHPTDAKEAAIKALRAEHAALEARIARLDGRKLPVLEESAVTAGKFTIVGGAFRSEKAAVARARKSIVEGAIVIHFAASARLGTPEGWWFAIPTLPK